MMKKSFIISLAVAILAIWIYVFAKIEGSLSFQGVITAVFCSVVTYLMLPAICEIRRRIENGVDVFATLETDPEKVKERMLYIMRNRTINGTNETLEELYAIFRNYPQLELEKWEVFRAWYKYLIDDFLRSCGTAGVIRKDGAEYSTATDRLYDPDAPDWKQFDRDRTYDYDDDYDDDDYFDDEYETKRKRLKDAAEEGLYMGIGFGVASDILGDSSHSGGE